MADRALTEPQRQAASRDERTRVLHPLRGGSNRSRHGVRPSPAIRRRLGEGIRGGPKRVEDGLVADRAASTAGEAVGRGGQHRAKHRGVQGRRIASRGASFQESGSIQRPGRPADGCHEPVAYGPEQLAGRRFWGQVIEHHLDGPEADDQVVSVVAVAEDRVEPGQVSGMSLDDDPAAAQCRPNIGGIDDVVAGDGRCSRHGRPTIVRPPGTGNATTRSRGPGSCAIATS